jgi:hypothetical protein
VERVDRCAQNPVCGTNLALCTGEPSTEFEREYGDGAAWYRVAGSVIDAFEFAP